jgi:hypothetical protein
MPGRKTQKKRAQNKSKKCPMNKHRNRGTKKCRCVKVCRK